MKSSKNISNRKYLPGYSVLIPYLFHTSSILSSILIPYFLPYLIHTSSILVPYLFHTYSVLIPYILKCHLLHDDSTNLVNNKQVQGWTQDGITRRNGGGGGGSVSNSSSDSSSMLSSQESEDEHDQNFLHTKSNEHRTKSVEETPLREDEDGEDDEDFEIETNFETNNPGGNPQVQIDPPPLAQSNTVIDVSKHASVPPEIPARSGSTSSIGSSIDKLSQRLKNTSMNNLATFDHSPKHTPKRGQKTDNNQSQSSSVEQLNNRNKSSDSEGKFV